MKKLQQLCICMAGIISTLGCTTLHAQTIPTGNTLNRDKLTTAIHGQQLYRLPIEQLAGSRPETLQLPDERLPAASTSNASLNELPDPKVSAAPAPTPAPTAAPQAAQNANTSDWYETGQASWYAGRFQGRQTANGEIFDTNLFTAAHKTLPFNTIVQVYNPMNMQSVLVRVNDRGPFVEGRVIDLSRAAAGAIGLTSQGVSTVHLRIVNEGTTQQLRLIQLGSFSEYANAVDLLRELEAVGFSAEIERSNVNAAIYRVIIPDIPQQQLHVQQAALAQYGFTDVLVRAKKN